MRQVVVIVETSHVQLIQGVNSWIRTNIGVPLDNVTQQNQMVEIKYCMAPGTIMNNVGTLEQAMFYSAMIIYEIPTNQ